MNPKHICSFMGNSIGFKRFKIYIVVFFVLKLLSAFDVRCIYSSALQTIHVVLINEANTMRTYQFLLNKVN